MSPSASDRRPYEHKFASAARSVTSNVGFDRKVQAISPRGQKPRDELPAQKPLSEHAADQAAHQDGAAVPAGDEGQRIVAASEGIGASADAPG